MIIQESNLYALVLQALAYESLQCGSCRKRYSAQCTPSWQKDRAVALECQAWKSYLGKRQQERKTIIITDSQVTAHQVHVLEAR